MNDSQIDSVDTLKDKVRKVVSMYQQQKEKNEKLNKENQELINKLKSAEQKLNELENQYKKLKLAKTMVASSQDARDAKLKVNRMVREIDKCIALLNR
ncbi:MAG: hypothetical protein ISS19_01135 [Bacteroidales bacterium]|nr:hypothetical protein [Bacteroidales bacterium]